MLTNSSLTTFRRCQREYQYAYVKLRKPKHKSDALRFGSLFHRGLNAWWTATGNAWDKHVNAVDAMRRDAESGETTTDPFELSKAEVLIAGYTTRWGDEPYETIAVEKNFRLPIDGVGCEYDQGGSIDAIAWRRSGPYRTWQVIVEHKTTSQDISPGSDYWRHVIALDSQVSTYMAAAREMGYYPRDCIYDVIRKPKLEPLKATPADQRKYTLATRSNPVPRLYANMREYDETPEEYGERLMREISSNPEKYYQRQNVVRLDGDNEKHCLDTIQTAEMIRFAEERDAWPRSTSACERYGRLCDYHDVCSGTADIDDSRYETKKSMHEELSE